jgi:hypothetical protein
MPLRNADAETGKIEQLFYLFIVDSGAVVVDPRQTLRVQPPPAQTEPKFMAMPTSLRDIVTLGPLSQVGDVQTAAACHKTICSQRCQLQTLILS